MCTLSYIPKKYECGHFLYFYVCTLPCELVGDTLAYCYTLDCDIEYLLEVPLAGTYLRCD